jgi:hypothetical protein
MENFKPVQSVETATQQGKLKAYLAGVKAILSPKKTR